MKSGFTLQTMETRSSDNMELRPRSTSPVLGLNEPRPPPYEIAILAPIDPPSYFDIPPPSFAQFERRNYSIPDDSATAHRSTDAVDGVHVRPTTLQQVPAVSTGSRQQNSAVRPAGRPEVPVLVQPDRRKSWCQFYGFLTLAAIVMILINPLFGLIGFCLAREYNYYTDRLS